MMQIGDLAARAGITTRTIRYYEELGIIEPEERTPGGFRLYSDSQLRRLHIVQELKVLGFGLERIRALFLLRTSTETGGGLARAMIQHLHEQQRETEAKIDQYMQARERTQRALEVLSGCLCCGVKVLDRDCHGCTVYRQHPDVPDAIECAVYETCR